MLSGWREHRPSYKVNRQDKTRRPARGGLDRQGLASDGHCVPFCPRWFLFNALLGIEQGVHRTPRVATVLKPRIISEVSVRYRARSSRFFPAVLGQARPPSIDARRSISVVVLSCSVFRPPRRSPANQSPRINSEVSARYTRYRTRSSQFFLAVCTAGTPAVRRPFGLGRCVAVFHSQGSREEPPANQFRGPLCWHVLSRCVGVRKEKERSGPFGIM